MSALGRRLTGGTTTTMKTTEGTREKGPLVKLVDKRPDDEMDWGWQLTAEGWASVEVFDGQLGESWKMWKPEQPVSAGGAQ